MENELTNEDIDLIMEWIPSVTEMGENTPLWNKLKRLKNKIEQKQHLIDIMQTDEKERLYNVFPVTVDEAGVIALKVLENVTPKLNTTAEAFFIAGFQECFKYFSQRT